MPALFTCRRAAAPERKARLRNLRALRRAQEGVTALEFALIAPVMMMMLMGTLETAIVIYASMVIESAMGNSSRLGKTGYSAENISREQTILNNIAARTGGMIDMSKVTVTTLAYESFEKAANAEPFLDANYNGKRDSNESYSDINGNGQWDGNIKAEGMGGAGDVVVYSVSYPWNISTPGLKNLLGKDGVYNIIGRTIVKNEPYDS